MFSNNTVRVGICSDFENLIGFLTLCIEVLCFQWLKTYPFLFKDTSQGLEAP